LVSLYEDDLSPFHLRSLNVFCMAAIEAILVNYHWPLLTI
jgi:hypothetical protein